MQQILEIVNQCWEYLDIINLSTAMLNLGKLLEANEECGLLTRDVRFRKLLLIIGAFWDLLFQENGMLGAEQPAAAS